MQQITDPPASFKRGPGETAFGVESVTRRGGTAEGTMQLGPWALHQDGSAVHQGAAGVLIDDVTAFAAAGASGADQWAVTSEISVDFHALIPVETQRLSCSATADHHTNGWGHSSGRLHTGAGELIATVGQRMRYFPGRGALPPQADQPTDAPSWLASLGSFLEPISRAGTRSEFRLKLNPGMRNTLGTLHGGISLGFSELAARTTGESAGGFPDDPLRTASIRMSYLRPGMLDEDLRVTAEILHSSRSVVIVEIRLLNTNQETVTFGVVTLHRVSSI